MRSNLLFAKSVLLVEGDAEAILLPLLIRKTLGVSLDELGISLVNIGSTGFSNISVLFHDQRIRRRCGIITDNDMAYGPTDVYTGDDAETQEWKKKMARSAASGAARKIQLDAEAAANSWVRPWYATYTFEIDLALVNQQLFLNAINDVYAQEAKRQEARLDLSSGLLPLYGKRVLAMATKEGKGWFAIMLGKLVDGRVKIPAYVLQAVAFAHGAFSSELVYRILYHRLGHYVMPNGHLPDAIYTYWLRVLAYRKNEINFNTLRTETYVAIPDDHVCDLFRAIQ